MQPAPAATDEALLRRQIAELEARLREAEETLEAIRNGEVDAVIVGHSDERRVYTIETADRPYRVLIEQMQEGAVTLAADCTVLYCNHRLADMLGSPQERVTGSSIFQFVPDAERDAFERLLGDSARGGGKGEFTLRTADGSSVPVYLSLVDLAGDGERVLCGVVTDLTQQKQRMSELSETNHKLATEIEERARTEDQLRQAQKMEAVGQLTGGLAHDFNNLLTVILGNLERAKAHVTNETLARQIDHARQAAERGAGLTQQLLAFSRRQSLSARSICINDLLPGLELLVRRALGEEIELQLVEADGLWHCQADPNQIESAVLNLAINARDAMPRGGTLRIETANVVLTENDAVIHPELRPGRYVAVSVADTGEGMAPEILARVFEPFFTTKDVGKGSGLGLSMVYGFARQSDGHVVIESEVNRGTTIRLYLPWAEKAASEDRPAPVVPTAPSRPALVLVVEDDPHVRPLVVQLVTDLGHAVVEAESGPEALEIIDRRPDLDLLFSDIVMPKGMSGIDLAREARRRRPGIAVLLTSGYTGQSLARDGAKGDEFRIIRKPYPHAELGKSINAVLADAHDRPRPAGSSLPNPQAMRVLAVEDDALIAMTLEDMLNDLGCQVIGPVSALAEALEAAASEQFDVALLDVNLGKEAVYPVADALGARGLPFAFMTGHDVRNLPEPYRRRPSLPKPYTASDLQRVLSDLREAMNGAAPG